MHKVITMCNKAYFQYGTAFLQTRNMINAQFVCYGPDLTDDQIKILYDHNIGYKKVEQELFDEKMQALKFVFLASEMDNSYDNDLIAFCDFDTFFVSNFTQLANEYDFDFGVTFRSDMIDRNCLRAFANGGVIFARKNRIAANLTGHAYQLMRDGYYKELPEYDEIWHTLEHGRKPEKTHLRTNMRWWVDQVFLSALAYKYYKTVGKGIYSGYLKYNAAKIKFFNCNRYNFIDATTECLQQYKDSGVYIGHLKNNTGASSNLKDG